MEKTTLSSIDLGKFVACFLIVLLHCNVIDNYETNWIAFMLSKGLLRIAVPFFFVTSGYFLGSKIAKGADVKTTITRYCKRLLFPLIVFSIINILQHIYTFNLNGDSFVKQVFRICRSIVFYPFGALWFVQACIVGAIMLIPFFLSKKLGYAVVIGIILFCIALPFNTYYFLVQDTPVSVIIDKILKVIASMRNGVFVGFVYLAIGSFIGYNHISLSKCMGGAILMISLILLFVEIHLVWTHWVPKDDTSLFLTHLILAPSILMVLLHTTLNIPVAISMTLRNLSVGIYYLHKPILYFATMMFMANINAFIATYIVSLLICMAAYHFNNTTLNKLLK